MSSTSQDTPAVIVVLKIALLWLWAVFGGEFAAAEIPGAMPKLDSTWGTSGVSLSGVNYAKKVLLLSNGSSIFVGDSCNQGSSCILLRKLTPSGTIDAAFRGNGAFVFWNAVYGRNYAIDAFLCDSNQNVLLVGGSNGKLFLAKVSVATGQLISSFGTSGVVHHTFGGAGDATTPTSAMIAKNESAVIVSANTSSTVGGTTSLFLVKMDVGSGAVDVTFGNQGIVATSTPIYALSPVGIDQKFVAGGSAGSSAALFQFDGTSGNLDTSFGTGGIASFQLGPTASTGRTDRVVDIVELPNDSRLAVATIRTSPLSVGVFTLFSNVVQLALFDRATNSIQSSFAAGAGYIEPANFAQTGLDIAAPHPRLVVNPRTNRMYVSADVDSFARYAAFNIDGTPDIEFGNLGALDAALINQMSPASNPPSVSWPIAVGPDTMTVGGYRPARLRLVSCDVDVDGDGHTNATTDGISLLGAMLGLPVGSDRIGTARPTAKAQRDYARLLIGSNVLDIDGDGSVLAETDGLILLRKLLGFKGAALTNGISISPNALRRSPADIENFLATACAL